MTPTADEPITLKSYLIQRVLIDDFRAGTPTSVWVVAEAVASTAIEHPEWPPLDEQRTWSAWEAWNR